MMNTKNMEDDSTDGTYELVSQWGEEEDVPRHKIMKNFKVPLEEIEVFFLSSIIIKQSTDRACSSLNDCKSHECTSIGNGNINVIQFESGVIVVL